MPLYISEYLDICDPVFTFEKLLEEADLDRFLKKIPAHVTGRIRYNPVSMLKTVLFGFMSDGYISLRSLEDNCRVNMRYMYLMDYATPSYRTFGYFINEVLADSVEDLFNEINRVIFKKEHGKLDRAEAAFRPPHLQSPVPPTTAALSAHSGSPPEQFHW